MTLPRSAADVLSGHVVFHIESIDRMYRNVWQPRLQHGAGAAAFFTSHGGHAYASTALMDPMTKAFVADMPSAGYAASRHCAAQHRPPTAGTASGEVYRGRDVRPADRAIRNAELAGLQRGRPAEAAKLPPFSRLGGPPRRPRARLALG